MRTEEEFIVARDLQENPFAITKAVDFTDSQIDTMWVDWPAPGGFAELMNVQSPMARIVLGGKGTGRTHVMRHFSAPVQAIRGGENPIAQVLEDGVLGIYVLCSGLNSSRFRGRSLDNETWQFIFSQYTDVWLAQAALEAFTTATVGHPPSDAVERAITEEVRKTLHNTDVNSGTSLAQLRKDLFGIQRRIDLAVNNAALSPDAQLDLVVQSTPGELVFGVPTALRHHYEPLRNITCLYLIDEFENFEVPQQQYVNSLIREKKAGTSFMIGVRTYGLRTLETLSGGEENKRGSEFEEIRPDRNYTGADRKKFEDFCRRVVARRLSGYGLMDDTTTGNLSERLSDFFELPTVDHEETLVIEHYARRERRYLARLRRQLARDPGSVRIDPADVDLVVEATRVPTRPLLEKVNVFLIYRAWAAGADLVKTAREMTDARSCPDPTGIVQPNTAQRSVLNHFVTDMQAQLCNDMRGRQMYAGIDQFITMSDGLPRNLLVILKNIYRWALFNGEQPFRGRGISLESQRLGVLEATKWFLADARPLGEDGEDVQAAIHRLGEMFRRFRFSDKPVESSLASFSADLTSCSTRAREVVELAEQWALLVSVANGQRDRNTGLVEPKFHLNRLLSPQWDLPTARRGAIRLSADEINAIFDPGEANQFKGVMNRRLERMNAPFGRRRGQGASQKTFDLDV